VISTRFGARGLGLTPGRHLVVAPLDAFAQEARALLADRPRMAELGRAGRSHVAERFDWRTIARQIDAALSRLAVRPGHA
jgi:glycosyltransferase involved in cell wall biosynthesis